MQTRVYFFIFDLLTNCSTGAVWCWVGLRVGCARWVFSPFSLSPDPPDLLELLINKQTTTRDFRLVWLVVTCLRACFFVVCACLAYGENRKSGSRADETKNENACGEESWCLVIDLGEYWVCHAAVISRSASNRAAGPGSQHVACSQVKSQATGNENEIEKDERLSERVSSPRKISSAPGFKLQNTSESETETEPCKKTAHSSACDKAD